MNVLIANSLKLNLNYLNEVNNLKMITLIKLTKKL